MRVDFSQFIKDFDDEPVKVPDGPGRVRDLTLGMCVRQALNHQAPNTPPLSFEESCRRGLLAIAISKGDEHDVSVEDAAMIRSVLPLLFGPVIVARCADMLDSKTSESKIKAVETRRAAEAAE